MLLDHCPILQAINANAAAGPRAHSASQPQVIKWIASGVIICPPPPNAAASRKFQKNGGVQPPGSPPSHNRQTDRGEDLWRDNKKGGSYLALLRFCFLNSFG
jgi:hypothetical protein